MWDLLWSILFSSLIFVVFKLFDTYNVSTFHAIIVNYVTALGTGILLYEGAVKPAEVLSQSWVTGALFLGILFIIIFNFMARTSQRLGVSVASIATKMSLVIPVVAGILLYSERLNGAQVCGIVLALAAVYLASLRENHRPASHDLRVLYLPLVVFIGSGVIDTSIKYMQETAVSSVEYPLFSAAIFGFAALTGTGVLLLKQPGDLKRIRRKNLLGGIALGIPNYFSVFFLLKALQYKGLNSASVFTINNVSIVMLTTLLGILLFRERLTWKNWMGVVLSIASIVLVSIS